MYNLSDQIPTALSTLSHNRKVFHSEDDLKLALAITLAKQFENQPDFEIRLEMPQKISYTYQNYDIDNLSITEEEQPAYIDMWINFQGKKYVVELKYRTKHNVIVVDQENFNLKDHAANDIGRYKFRQDLFRLSQLKQKGIIHKGFAIFLTNDAKFWTNKASKNNLDIEFHITDGEIIPASAKWNINSNYFQERYIKNGNFWVSKKTGTKSWIYGKEYTKKLNLENDYQIHWKDYSLNEKEYQFKYLLIEV